MRGRLGNIYNLGLKELLSLRRDTVLIILILYSFTYGILGPARSAALDINNAAIAVADEDHSVLSMRIRDAFLRPYFQPPAEISPGEIDAAMDSGRYTFVVDIPPKFEADVLRGRRPTIQVNVDATAMSQAGRGAQYIAKIIAEEVAQFAHQYGVSEKSPAVLVARAKFNPNLVSSWFIAVMHIVNNITVLAMFLTGAAFIREREHGTIEHLLVMPLTPTEIMLAKVWSSALVIVGVSTLSLYLIVQGVLGVPIAGSVALFVCAAAVYLFSITSLGILLATFVRSMPQFGLLAFPVFIVMNLLSGGNTPLDTMPEALQYMMQLSPSTHFVSLAQAILYRGADIGVVWPQFLMIAGLGVAFFTVSLLRFRRTLALIQA